MWTEIKAMQEYLEIEVSDDPNEICERMRTINVYMARSSRMPQKQRLIEERLSEIRLLRFRLRQHACQHSEEVP